MTTLKATPHTKFFAMSYENKHNPTAIIGSLILDDVQELGKQLIQLQLKADIPQLKALGKVIDHLHRVQLLETQITLNSFKRLS